MNLFQAALDTIASVAIAGIVVGSIGWSFRSRITRWIAKEER